jgi:septum formation protein
VTRLVLASGSPRRLELLRLAGFDPEVRIAGIDESTRPGELPVAYVARLAREKAAAVPRGADEVVLAADTTVVLDGESIGKPGDATEAAATLRRLSGRAHEVSTGVAVVAADGTLQEAVVTTRVEMAVLDEASIARYVATGEPLDKAGAYGIQGAAQVLVAAVHGSWTNVVGLPAVESAALLRRAGCTPR